MSKTQVAMDKFMIDKKNLGSTIQKNSPPKRKTEKILITGGDITHSTTSSINKPRSKEKPDRVYGKLPNMILEETPKSKPNTKLIQQSAAWQ